MKILAVDDDAISLEILAHTLREKGHEVVTAGGGDEAMSVLGENSVPMVVTDWMMPGTNGLALCKWIRAQRFPAYVYVVMLTSRTATADIVEGLSAGADEFLFKPFDPAELEARVRAGERILQAEYNHMTIFALAKLAESRDPETGRHLDRIREYSRLLGAHLARKRGFAIRLSPGDIETIYHTSPLHDIGKVGIPDSILLKPGRLDPDEFAVMKTHTIIGGKTLGQALAQYPGARFLQTARDIAFWHHEKYNGEGYPHGLAGEEIPLCARIVALADVYDALTSQRPYKPAYPHETARDFIVAERGKHFDPDVADSFVETERAFADIAKRLAASEQQTESSESLLAADAR